MLGIRCGFFLYLIGKNQTGVKRIKIFSIFLFFNLLYLIVQVYIL